MNVPRVTKRNFISTLRARTRAQEADIEYPMATLGTGPPMSLEGRLRAQLRNLAARTGVLQHTPGDQGNPCPGCHLRLVCRTQGLACADRLAFLLGQPLKGRRLPRLVLGLRASELLAEGGERG